MRRGALATGPAACVGPRAQRGELMRVALYARVSSEQQEQRGTVASQLTALRGYAQQHQMDICDDYVCVDEGYSGTRLARPGLR